MLVTRAPLPGAPKWRFLHLAEGFLPPSVQIAGPGRAAYSSLRPFWLCWVWTVTNSTGAAKGETRSFSSSGFGAERRTALQR